MAKITQTFPIVMKSPDMLELMLSQQKKLIKKIEDTKNPIPEIMEKRFFDTMGCAMHECIEARDTTNWKTWKKSKPWNIEESKEELIDVLHFIIQGSIDLGMDAKEVSGEFTRKHKINIERQNNNY